MDPDRVAARLGTIHDRLSAAAPDVLVHGQVDTLRYEIVGEDEASSFPGGNPNRVRWYGGPVDESAIEAVISRFDAHDIPVWFLHAFGQTERGRLQDACERYGFETFTDISHLVLTHDLTGIDDPPTTFTIRELGPVPAGYEGMVAGPVRGQAAMALAAEGTCSFFGAFAGTDLVALAGLLTVRDSAYLGWAITREDRRGQGAQRALIAARLHQARGRGCRIALSETTSMLTTSLGNLHAAGFHIATERLVMRYGE